MHRTWQGGERQDELGCNRTQLSQMVLGYLIFQEMERSGQQSKRAALLIGLCRTKTRKSLPAALGISKESD